MNIQKKWRSYKFIAIAFIKRYWAYLFIIIFDLVYLQKFARLTGWASWDFPGHLYQTHSSLLNLYESVYSFSYFLGYYPILYPPIGISLISFIHSVFYFVDIFVIAILLIYVSRIVFFYFLYKVFELKNSDKFIYIAISCIFIVTSLTFNTVTIWESGALSASIAYAFLGWLIYYIYSCNGINNLKSSLVVGLLLGLIILTHTITASVALLFIAIVFISELFNRNIIGLKFCFYSILIGFLIGAIWLIPYIDLNDLMPKTGVGGYKYYGVYILNFILLVFLLNNYKDGLYNKADYILTITGVLLLILSMISAPFNFLRIHNSRYLYYGIIFIAPFIMIGKNNIKINKLAYWCTSLALLLLFVLMIYQRDFLTRLSPYNKLEYIRNIEISGRVLDASSLSSSTTFPHLVNTFLVNNNSNLVSTGGLFVESAPNGIYALALRASINDAAWFPLYNTYYKYYIKPTQIYEKAELLGVKNIVTSTGKLPDEFTEHTDQIETIGSVSYFGNADYYLHQLSEDIKLVDVLDYHPQYIDQVISPINLWNNLNLKNIYTYDKNIDNFKDLDLSDNISDINNIQVESDKLSFTLDSEKIMPIYVKFAYSKNLKAFDGDGNPITILKVSPDFMLVYGKGNITLQNYIPFSYQYAWWITIVSLLMVVSSIVYLKYKEYR